MDVNDNYIIIRLLQTPLHSPAFLRNSASEEQSSMKGVVWKEKLIIYLANLAVNGHPQELGTNETKVIVASSTKSRTTYHNMYAALYPKEGLIYHR